MEDDQELARDLAYGLWQALRFGESVAVVIISGLRSSRESDPKSTQAKWWWTGGRRFTGGDTLGRGTAFALFVSQIGRQ